MAFCRTTPKAYLIQINHHAEYVHFLSLNYKIIKRNIYADIMHLRWMDVLLKNKYLDVIKNDLLDMHDGG